MDSISSRVYYGEYSLTHWIKLMLSKNIEIPEYQRHFVWNEKDIKRLIKSLKEKQFVQPITIALYNIDDNKKNLIIDGQQRLTSVLLAYLGILPDRDKFSSTEFINANDDDSSIDDNEDIPNNTKKTPILWKFDMLLENNNNKKEDILKRLRDDNRYVKFDIGLTDDFFENTFIGFSYIIPETTDKEKIEVAFSQLFRNINYYGKSLTNLESRKSLYFQNPELTKFFEGKDYEGNDVLCNIKILENFQPFNIDFVRYLSILSQYYSNGYDPKKVLVGYSSYRSRESYYSDYVSFILGKGIDEQEDYQNKFDTFNFEETLRNCWKDRFVILKNNIETIKSSINLRDGISFETWIDADYWLFGLIYYIVFKGKTLKNERLPNLREDISNKIENKRNETAYVKSSNRLGNIRERLKESCDIYSRYVQ